MSGAEDYLRTRVSELIENLTVDVLISKPTQVVDFMIAWLEENGAKYDAPPAAKVVRRPSGIESSNDEDDEYVDELPLPVFETNAPIGRRSVAAEKFTSKAGGFVPRVVPKDPAEKERIARLLSRQVIFSALERADLNIIVDAMEVKTVAAGEQIIRQGDNGNELFVVSTGVLECFRESPNGDKSILRTYSPGEFFGELALLYNSPRAASVVAVEDSQLYSLDRQTFNQIVKSAMMTNATKFEAFLERVPVLSQLSAYERSRLADCLEVRNYNEGELVIREGDRGDRLFLVVEGSAVATKKNPALGTEVEVLHYDENSYFGELALLKDEPRAASVRATCALKCACIDRNAFKRILGSLEEIMRRNAEHYVRF